jgi:hypothetical protein
MERVLEESSLLEFYMYQTSGNNLPFVLYLTRNIGFTVHINSSHMSFERPTGTPC